MVCRHPGRGWRVHCRAHQALTALATLRRRLAFAGIACFLVISAFGIHRWRVGEWRAFEAGFADLGQALFGYPPSPVWLYAVAFPFVATNFFCLVQIARGKARRLFTPFVVSAAAIAVMPFVGRQGAVYRTVWEDSLTLIGFAIGGALALLLWPHRGRGAKRAAAES